jgi:hypothetical protein
VAGNQTDFVTELEEVGGGRNGEAAVLVGGALVGRGGLVTDERRARIEGERLGAGVDDSLAAEPDSVAASEQGNGELSLISEAVKSRQ